MGSIPTALDEPSLLERAAPIALLQLRAAAGRGSLVLLAGEAGIGKSAVVRELARRSTSARVLWGACDPLDTPRPLGPLTDVADDTGGELAAAVGAGGAPGEIVAALGRELRRKPSIVVLEDLHWADGATLDVLRVLGRRVESMPGLILATYRDDSLGRTHPLRVAVGELTGPGVERITLEPLSLAAVEELAAPAGLDGAELHRRTGGNPFFVTEVIATEAGGELPATVRDAVLARAARLPEDARAVLDAVAIVPHSVEFPLLEALTGGELGGLDACLASGILRDERQAVSFRHEIARLTVEQALPPHQRIALHRRTLAALAAAPVPDLDRIAHFAEGAGDIEAVLRYAPAAGERAAELRAHREAAHQFARALRFADHLPAERRAELLERRAYECYLTGDIPAAAKARRLALAEHAAVANRRGEGDAHRWLSRLAWFDGDNAAAEDHARQAVELLEPLGDSRELAMAYSNMAQLRMLAHDAAAAVDWGTRAIELAEAFGDDEILVHALNNVGAARWLDGVPEGIADLERSLRLALDAGLEEHVARAYTNLGAAAHAERDYVAADRLLEQGIGYCREHDLDSWVLYMTGYAAWTALGQGRWDDATGAAAWVLDHPGVAVPTRIVPLMVLGLVRARRGDPDVWAALDEARDLAAATGEVQRIGPVAVARAEAHWLEGGDDAVAADTAAALDLAADGRDSWLTGELAVWRRRAGVDEPLPAGPVAEPLRLELAGDAAAAAARWEALGSLYEAALARAHAESDDDGRGGLDQLQALGARPAARRVARVLRSRGVRDLREGPRAATRDNAAGLTSREVEVLGLVAEGLRNAEIAERLFLSQKTVAHHVSSILRKLGVETRTQAGAEAVRQGLIER